MLNADEPSPDEQAATAEADAVRHIERIARTVAAWKGYNVQSVSSHMDGDGSDGELTIRLMDFEGRSAWLHLARVWYLKADGLYQHEGGVFIDEIRVTRLPTDPRYWPEAVRERIGTWAHAPALVWVDMIGPWTFEAIAQFIEISVAPPEPGVVALQRAD